MKLDLLYRSAEEAIRGLDLARIWPGFAPLKFALFDAERCFFDGRYVERPTTSAPIPPFPIRVRPLPPGGWRGS